MLKKILARRYAFQFCIHFSLHLEKVSEGVKVINNNVVFFILLPKENLTDPESSTTNSNACCMAFIWTNCMKIIRMSPKYCLKMLDACKAAEILASGTTIFHLFSEYRNVPENRK